MSAEPSRTRPSRGIVWPVLTRMAVPGSISSTGVFVVVSSSFTTFAVFG